MPGITIPFANQSQVAPVVQPSIHVEQNAPIENFGGGRALAETGEAISGVTKVTNDIFLQQKKAADDAVGQDVFARLTKKKNDLIYDPKEGALTKKGQDALDVTNTYGKAFDDYANDVGSTLANDDQRKQFEHFRRQTSDELNSTLTKYTFGESQNLQEQIATSAVKAAQDDAILNYHDSGKIQNSIALQSNLLTNTLRKNGMTQDVIDQQVSTAVSKTHAGIIDRMLVNDQDIQARDYYNSVKDKLVATDAVSVEKSLEAGAMRGESQRKADNITSSYDSLSDALDASREIKDPKLRDETTKRVKEYFSDQDQARKTDDDNRFNSASQILEKTGGSLDAIPPQMLANMSSANRRALEARSTQLKNGVEPQSNSEDFYNLQTMAASPELRDKFLKLNLMEFRHKITQGEMSEAIKLQTSIRKQDGEADDALHGIRTRTQSVSETLKAIGIDKDPEAVLAVNRAVDEQIAQFTKQNNKKPNGIEIQKMVDNVVVKAKDPNSSFFNIFGPSRAYEFPTNSQLTVNIDDIPVSEKNQITKALNARNIPVSDDKIVDLYTRKLNGMRQRGQ